MVEKERPAKIFCTRDSNALPHSLCTLIYSRRSILAMAGPLDIGVLDQTVTKYLSRAGTDPRCTPKMLREKTEDKMKLERGTLDAFKPRIKKLIIKWWKETGKEQVGNGSTSSAANVKEESPGKAAPEVVKPSEEEVKTWKAFKAFAKASGKSAGLLAGLNEIKVAGERIAALKKRIEEAGLSFSEPYPTEEEIAGMKEGQEKKRSLEGGEAEEPPLKKEA